jgi:hypothetical protein
MMPISERQLNMGVDKYIDMLNSCKTYEDVEKCKGYGAIVFKQLRKHKLFGKAQILAHRAYTTSISRIGVKND